MDAKYLQYLLDRFLSGNATASEKEELDTWYKESNNTNVIWEIGTSKEEWTVEQRMRKNIIKHVHASKPRLLRLNTKLVLKVAASIIGLILMASFFYLRERHQRANFSSASVVTPVSSTENKYLVLPDGSKVLLHPGSRIHYDFKDKVRELTLVGEAYFDIKHMANKPFIIHTGKLTTTVLGTAFNISAYPGQIVIVSVTRGKVSLADETKKTVAVLAPDQEAKYNLTSKVTTQEKVKATETIIWVKADMQFDSMAYKELAKKLERRYGVIITFKNTDMEKCLITGRFTGTESIEQVMHIISETLQTEYTIEGNIITVDGTACQQ